MFTPSFSIKNFQQQKKKLESNVRNLGALREMGGTIRSGEARSGIGDQSQNLGGFKRDSGAVRNRGSRSEIGWQ